MSVVVINHLRLSVPVDELTPTVEAEFGPVFLAQPGFERFRFVKVAPDEAIVLIDWASGEAAAAGAAVIGPSLFAQHIGPVLRAEQDRHTGPVVVEVGPS